MPDFTIIAGPNGAGKSTFSKGLSAPGSLIFDADKIKAIREREYPDVPDESIQMMIDAAYWDVEEIAIGQGKDFTVETNLRNDFLIRRAVYFTEKGYKTNLLFMLLPNIETSMERVDKRVSQKGHFVDIESIKYNFEYSLIMLKQHFNKFDSLYLFDSSLDINLSVPNPLLICKSNQISYIDPNAPVWAKPILNELVQKLTTT